MNKVKDKAAQSLGRRGGKVKSKAKSAAARKNGKKGGRPKKSDDTCVRHKWFNGLNDAESKYQYCGKCGNTRSV